MRRTPRESSKLGVWIDDILRSQRAKECVGDEEKIGSRGDKGSFKRSFIQVKPWLVTGD